MTEQYRLRTTSRLWRKQGSSNSRLMMYKPSLLTIAPRCEAKIIYWVKLSLDTKPKVQSTLLDSNSFTNGLEIIHWRDGRSSRSQTCPELLNVQSILVLCQNWLIRTKIQLPFVCSSNIANCIVNHACEKVWFCH